MQYNLKNRLKLFQISLLGLAGFAQMSIQSGFSAAPTVLSVSGNVANQTITVVYSTNVSAATALSSSNYLVAEFGIKTNGFWTGARNQKLLHGQWGGVNEVLPLTSSAFSPGLTNEVVLNVNSLNKRYYTLRIRNVRELATSTPITTTNITFWGDDPNMTPPAAFGAFPGVETLVSQVNYPSTPPSINIWHYISAGDFTGGYFGYPLFTATPFNVGPALPGPDGNVLDVQVQTVGPIDLTEFAAHPTSEIGYLTFEQGNETWLTNSGGAGPTAIKSPDFNCLKYYFDGQAAGIDGAAFPGHIQVNGELDLLGPTIDPANAGNGTPFEVSAHVEGQFNISSNWQTFAMPFIEYFDLANDFPINSGTGSNDWTSVYNKIQTMKPICNMNQFVGYNDIPGDWGYDKNNFIALANFRLVAVDTNRAPALTITPSGTNVIVSWALPDKLQAAFSPNGPYVDVFDAVNGSFTNFASTNSAYYRARAPLP